MFLGLDIILGLDISKANFDAALLDSSPSLDPSRPEARPAHRAFPNTPAGFERLAAWLAAWLGDRRVHACLEATNTYGDALARSLHEQGHTVSVVCPGGHYFVSTLPLSEPSPARSPPGPRRTRRTRSSSPATA